MLKHTINDTTTQLVCIVLALSKFIEKLCVMTKKNNAKFEEELARHFKIDMRNLTNFDLST